MKKNILFLFLCIALVIPIFYTILCFSFSLNLFSSETMDTFIKILYALKNNENLNDKVYISLIYSFLPTVIILIRIITSNNLEDSYGYAKFATLRDIKKMGLNFKGGFCFGIFKGKKIYSDDSYSTLVIASPGTGKTSSTVIPNLLSIKHSCIILDIKKELAHLTSAYRRDVLKNEVFIFDPYGDDNSFYFNPFSKKVIQDLNFDEQLTVVKEVSNVLFKDENSRDPHWIIKARKLFIFFTMYDIAKHEETNLFELMRYPMKSDDELLNEEYLLKKEKLESVENDKQNKEASGTLKLFFQQVSCDEDINSLIQDMAREFERSHNKELQSVISSYGTKMEVFTDRRVASVVQDMSFKYIDLREKNISVYICVKEKDIKTLSPLIQVFTEVIGKNLLDKENSNKEQRVAFILDEFTRFGKLEFLLELPTLSRSYNLPTIFLTQTEAQIEKYYSLADLRIISGACHYKILFTINDFKTAENMSKDIGTLTRKKVSQTSQENKLFGSKNKSLEGYNLLTPQDLQNIPKDEVIISVFGNKATPIKAKVNYWFKDTKFRRILKEHIQN